MTERTIVVFGGTGFLGRAIVRAFTARGDAVRVAARRPDAAGMPPGVELRRADIQDDAAAVASAAHTADTTGRVFALGGNEVLRYREIVQAVLSHRRRWRPLLPVPWTAWRGIAHAGKMLSNPPLTIDQVVLMQADNIVSADMATFADLGIEARGLRASLTECLPGWLAGSTPSRYSR